MLGTDCCSTRERVSEGSSPIRKASSHVQRGLPLVRAVLCNGRRTMTSFYPAPGPRAKAGAPNTSRSSRVVSSTQTAADIEAQLRLLWLLALGEVLVQGTDCRGHVCDGKATAIPSGHRLLRRTLHLRHIEPTREPLGELPVVAPRYLHAVVSPDDYKPASAGFFLRQRRRHQEPCLFRIRR